MQMEISHRNSTGKPTSCTNIFAAKIVCGDCGGWYGKKIWGSYMSDKTKRREIWRCNDKYKRPGGKPGNGCGTPHIMEDKIKTNFFKAFNKLMTNRDGLIEEVIDRVTVNNDGEMKFRFRSDKDDPLLVT